MLKALWHEWIADNPFLQRDLRRFRRSGYLWKMPLWTVAPPLLAVLGLHALYLRMGGWGGISLGLVLLSAVSLLHVIAFASWSGAVFSLTKEAAADSLEFVRLLPLPRRELLVKIGLARAAIRLVPLLVALPVYLLLFSYGGIAPVDVAAVYALLALFLFAPPGVAEVTTALTTKQGGGNPELAVKSSQQAATTNGIVWMIGMQVTFQVLLRPVIGPLIWGAWSRLSSAIGPDLGRLLPLSIVAGTARAAWEPQWVFGWLLSPLLLLLPYWALRTVAHVASSAELWSREPTVQTGPQGRTTLVLDEESGRPDERRAAGRLNAVLGIGLLVLTTGLLWQSSIASGALGFLAGSSTPAGGLATLLIVCGGLGLLAALESLRSGKLLRTHPGRTAALRVATAGWGRWTAGVLVALLLSALLGGIAPWPEPAWALGRLLLVAAATLLFASGWGLLNDQPPVEKAPPARQAVTWVSALFWLASYLLPLTAMVRPGLPPAFHLAAALSPIYAYLQLLPGGWRAPSPRPFAVSVALPAALGLLALLMAPRRRDAAERPASRRKDPLEERVRAVAARWDNPALSLAVARLQRQSLGLTLRVLGATAGAFALTLLIGVMVAAGMTARSGAPWWTALPRPTPVAGLTAGALLGLGLSLGLLWLLAFMGATVVSAAVSTESSLGRQQRRLPYVLITPLAHRELMFGTLGSALLAAAPSMTGYALGSLFWLMFALAFGAPLWWPAAWVALASGGVAIAVHTALAGFEDWLKGRGLRYVIRAVPRAGCAVFISIGWMVVAGVFGAQDRFPLFLQLLPWGVAATVLLALATLPPALRRAEACVRTSRREDDLERTR
jgi:hypothetical protein